MTCITTTCTTNEPRTKRRILLVDDDLAVLLTRKAVLELHGFEVETAVSSAEAFARMESGVYQMIISDLRMETEDAGLEVIRRANLQAYDPATALLTACAPPEEFERGARSEHSAENGSEHRAEDSSEHRAEKYVARKREGNGGDRVGANPDSVLIKPLGTSDLLRQVEALLVSRADRQLGKRISAPEAQQSPQGAE